MTYLSDKARKRPVYVRYFLFALVVGVFIYFWPQVSSTIYSYIEAGVVSYGSAKTGVIEAGKSVTTSKRELFRENKELQLSVESLENQLAEKEGILRERDLLIEASSTSPIIILYPLARDALHIYSTILFSKGTNDRIWEGQVVYVRGMQPVCRIVEVYESTSLCKLFSKGGEMTEGVLISNGSTTEPLSIDLIGEGGGSFSVVLPKSLTVYVGDKVYLRSNQHMKIGEVISIIEDEQAIGSKVFIRGAYNPLTSSVFYTTTFYDY